MNSKIIIKPSLSAKIQSPIKKQTKNKNFNPKNHKQQLGTKSFSKIKGNNNEQTKLKKKEKEKVDNSIKQKKLNNIIINLDDSSTNCLSKNNKKNIITKIDNDNNIKININEEIQVMKNDNYIIPSLVGQKGSEAESLFINFKLGEKDLSSNTTLKSDINNLFSEFKNIKLMKNNCIQKNNYNNNKNIFNKKTIYNHCNVDNTIGQSETDSLEIYDFTDKANVDYVLKNLSLLSHSKDKSSVIFESIDDEDKKDINEIKIFNTNRGISNINNFH